MEELSDYLATRALDLDDPARTNGATHAASDAANGTGANGKHATGESAGEVALGDAAPTSSGRARADTWGSHLPALRLAPVAGADAAAEQPDPAPEPLPVRDPFEAPVPPSLRATRGLIGALLLFLAWSATAACFALGRLLLGGFPQEQALAPRAGLYLVTALAAGWVGVVALACVVAAAFALSLAITSRGW